MSHLKEYAILLKEELFSVNIKATQVKAELERAQDEAKEAKAKSIKAQEEEKKALERVTMLAVEARDTASRIEALQTDLTQACDARDAQSALASRKKERANGLAKEVEQLRANII